jgi:transposase
MDSSLRLNRHHRARGTLGEEEDEPVEKHTVVAVDIAKVVFEVAVSEEVGRVARRQRVSRAGFRTFFAQMPKATVVLLPPHQVRPCVTREKTDRTDAKGILEAYRNADIRLDLRRPHDVTVNPGRVAYELTSLLS